MNCSFVLPCVLQRGEQVVGQHGQRLDGQGGQQVTAVAPLLEQSERRGAGGQHALVVVVEWLGGGEADGARPAHGDDVDPLDAARQQEVGDGAHLGGRQRRRVTGVHPFAGWDGSAGGRSA